MAITAIAYSYCCSADIRIEVSPEQSASSVIRLGTDTTRNRRERRRQRPERPARHIGNALGISNGWNSAIAISLH